MLHGAVPDLQRSAQGEGAIDIALVQFSRVASLGMLFILRPFDIAELRTPLSDELLADLAWEEEMACSTKRQYDM